MKPVFKIIAELVISIFIFLVLWSAAGRLMTSRSDLAVFAGILLIIIILCLIVLVARTIYLQAKEIISNGPQNQ